jgi:3-phenylpropionate/trans-cinnamate dioxygenase ferredoxin subunit
VTDGWVSLGRADDARPGQMRAYDLGEGRVVAVAWLGDGSLAAFDDTCTHEECPLSEGDLEGTRIICYCHNSAFELDTGAVVRGPAEDPIAVYDVRVAAGALQIRADGAEETT